MTLSMNTHVVNTPSFTTLLAFDDASILLSQLGSLIEQQYQLLGANEEFYDHDYLYNHSLCLKRTNNEDEATTKLIILFNTLFAKQRVQLIHGDNEPEYFPAKHNQPARIEFAHGFFASALHEISHWCVAGKARRQLNDFGYWYAPDGRSASQQQAFERVEVKPQAIECLFTLACQRPFQVSQDNLFADFDTGNSTFANDVYQQVKHYITSPQSLPRDAQILLYALLRCITNQL